MCRSLDESFQLRFDSFFQHTLIEHLTFAVNFFLYTNLFQHAVDQTSCLLADGSRRLNSRCSVLEDQLGLLIEFENIAQAHVVILFFLGWCYFHVINKYFKF